MLYEDFMICQNFWFNIHQARISRVFNKKLNQEIYGRVICYWRK